MLSRSSWSAVKAARAPMVIGSGILVMMAAVFAAAAADSVKKRLE